MISVGSLKLSKRGRRGMESENVRTIKRHEEREKVDWKCEDISRRLPVPGNDDA